MVIARDEVESIVPGEYAEFGQRRNKVVFEEEAKVVEKRENLDAPTKCKNEMQCSTTLEIVFGGGLLVGPVGRMSVGLFG